MECGSGSGLPLITKPRYTTGVSQAYSPELEIHTELDKAKSKQKGDTNK